MANININTFFEHGFSVLRTTENGTIFLHKTGTEAEREASEQKTASKNDRLQFYDRKTGKAIDIITLNAHIDGTPLQSPEIIDDGIYFIKDYVTSDFVRCNLNPKYLPLVAFKGSLLFCTIHADWEELKVEQPNPSQSPATPLHRTSCGLKPYGYYVNIEEKKNGVLSNVFAFRLCVKSSADALVTIEYIYLHPKALSVQTDTRIISLKNGDILSDCKCITEKNKTLPPSVYNAVMKILTNYIKKKYGIDITYKDFSENQNYITAIFASPYEPALYFLRELIPEIRAVNLKCPNCFNELCKKIAFKPWRTFRKAFNKSYKAFYTYIAACLLGFKDKNIINEMLLDDAMHVFPVKLKAECDPNAIDFADDFSTLDDIVPNEENVLALPAPSDIAEAEKLAFFGRYDRTPLYNFYAQLLEKRSERAVWSVIKRNVRSYPKEHISDIYDAAEIFFRVRNNIDTVIEKKILDEGLTKYNHQLLVNVELVYKYRQWLEMNGGANKPIEYTRAEKRLECAINGYSFRLVESPMKLFMIGQILHNCVGTYLHKILAHYCIIVYAMKNGAINLCIEVRGKTIHQVRTAYNDDPKDEDLEAFNGWKKACDLWYSGYNRF